MPGVSEPTRDRTAGCGPLLVLAALSVGIALVTSQWWIALVAFVALAMVAMFLRRT